MFERIDVASISFAPVKFALEANADRLELMFRKAAVGGAQLALAPEGVLEGYVVMDIIEGRVEAQRMREVAVTIRSRMVDRFRDLARELNMCLAFGLAERIGEEIYNSAVFIDHSGRLCGKYHKMQLAEGYHQSWWYNRLGKTSRAFDTPFGRCGFLICNDRWNPDIARIPVLDGAQFLLIPSYGSCAKSQDDHVLARARENGVPIVEANVGVAMVVNKGEIAALSRKRTGIIFSAIEIPARPSMANRDRQEGLFVKWRRKEMAQRYRVTMEKIKHFSKKGTK